MLHRFLQSKMDPPGDLSNTMGDFFHKKCGFEAAQRRFHQQKGVDLIITILWLKQ